MAAARSFPWTQKQLQSLIQYDPNTGRFTRNGKPTGTLRKDGRYQIRVTGSLWLSSRLAWFWMTGQQIPAHLTVDHDNRNRSDDSWKNLKLATRAEQAANRDCVEFKAGYQWNSQRQQWLVRAVTRHANGHRVTHSFGSFTCEERAKAAAAIMKAEMDSRLAVRLHRSS